MHDIIVRLAHAIAPRFLSGNRASNVAMALKLRRLFSTYKIATVIDVGANQGQYRNFLRDRVGFKGHIHSFEPIPELAAELTEWAKSDRHWSIHPVALGAGSGEIQINVMAHTEFSSVHQPTATVDSATDRMNTVVRTIRVPVITLDSMFAGTNGLKHTYLKIDTQGFDLEVLKGAEETVSEIHALQTEVSFRPIYKGAPDFEQSFLEFRRRGFSVADLFLVLEDPTHRAMEFDCVMVK
jgi:FkbM family methyltransferase